MIGVLKKGDTDLHTRRTPCEHEDRDRGDGPTSQGMPNTASKPPEVRGNA